MPVSFLTTAQIENYGRYSVQPTPDELTRFFHLSEDDRLSITRRRGHHNRLGFALQLTTVRYLGTFLEDPLDVPLIVLQTLSRQLDIIDMEELNSYRSGEQRWDHASEIRIQYEYLDINDPGVGFRWVRWLYGLCWTGTNRPSVLFDRAKSLLLTHKVLLPGITTLERLISRIRSRAENRLYCMLRSCINQEQAKSLENLLTVPEGTRRSLFEKLRSGPFRISSPSLVEALLRLQAVRDLGISLPVTAHIPQCRLAAIARFASTVKVTAIIRLPPLRRLATLAAFIHCLEAKAHDDALDPTFLPLRSIFLELAHRF